MGGGGFGESNGEWGEPWARDGGREGAPPIAEIGAQGIGHSIHLISGHAGSTDTQEEVG